MFRRAAWLLLLALLVSSCGSAPEPPLPQEAYVWQRVWTDALRSAVQESARDLQAFRVLAAEADRDGRLQPFAIDSEALRLTARPVTLVIRIDGGTPRWDRTAMLDAVTALLAAQQAKLLTLSGLEIDYDCATVRLSEYAVFLKLLHAQLPAGVQLSITTLPTWLGSPGLDAVLAAVDQAVLQVHGVSSPERGLFDAAQAFNWAQRFAAHTPVPFRVALPTYGYWLREAEAGLPHVVVAAEVDAQSSTEAGQELFVEPQAVRRFTERLRQARLPRLAGIVWFRVPTADDRRAWSPATWRAMLGNAPLVESIVVQALPGRTPGLQELRVTNTGTIDAAMPARVLVEPACAPADAVGGYHLAQADSALRFERSSALPIRAGASRLVGWMRCETDSKRRIRYEP